LQGCREVRRRRKRQIEFWEDLLKNLPAFTEFINGGGFKEEVL
jgi:hypothetical protein